MKSRKVLIQVAGLCFAFVSSGVLVANPTPVALRAPNAGIPSSPAPQASSGSEPRSAAAYDSKMRDAAPAANQREASEPTAAMDLGAPPPPASEYLPLDRDRASAEGLSPLEGAFESERHHALPPGTIDSVPPSDIPLTEGEGLWPDPMGVGSNPHSEAHAGDFDDLSPAPPAPEQAPPDEGY